jgi:hypothetical protein
MLRAASPSILPFVIGSIAVGIIALGFRKAKRRHKRRSKGISAFGWALLFLSSGRMPPPPPESQIEQDLSARNNRSQSAGTDHEPPVA